MNKNRDIIDCIEKIRVAKKIPIKELTKGIVSTRNYSRYLSKELDITFEIVLKMIHRLDMPLFQFANYSRNILMIENANEVYFADYVINGHYKEAYEKYYKNDLIDKTWKTFLAHKVLPMAVCLMKSKLNLVHSYEALETMRRHIDLPALKSSKMIFYEDIIAMALYIDICDEEDKETMADILYDVLINEKAKVLSTNLEMTYISAYHILLKAMTHKKKMGANDHKKIERVFLAFLAYHRKAKTAFDDIAIFKTMYDYQKKYEIDSPYLTFHFFLSFLSTGHCLYINEDYVSFDKDDVQVFVDLLDNRSLLREGMYERLMENGIV